MQVTHKIRLQPNSAQETYFRQAAGTARFAYNWGLAEWQRQYKAGEKQGEAASAGLERPRHRPRLANRP